MLCCLISLCLSFISPRSSTSSDAQVAKMLADRVEQLSNDQFEELVSKVTDGSIPENHRKVLPSRSKSSRSKAARRKKQLVVNS